MHHGELTPVIGGAAGGGPWTPLRIRVYRALWIAGLVSNVGTFMHLVAASWAVTLVSKSPTMVSLVQTAWAVPGFLLALHAGAFADMFDRRRLLIGTQLAALVVALAMAIPQLAHPLPAAALLVGTFLESIALTMAAPAFMALTPDLVGRDLLPQALGLDSISRNVAQAIGPAIAGLVIARAGPGAVFLLNAVSFVGVVAVVSRFQTRPQSRTESAGVSVAIRAGVVHVAGSSVLRRLAIRLALTSGFVAAFAALLPIVARQRLRVGASGFGLLTAALGVGSVLAAWASPRLRAAQRPDRTLLVAAVVWSSGAALLAMSSELWVALIAMVVAGAGALGALNVLFATYTVLLPSWVRGRGSAIAMLMVWLGTSIGAVSWGAATSAFGVRTALLAAAVGNLIVAGAARSLLPIVVGQPLGHADVGDGV